mmetsp:Transcript_42049/g.112938  ORF Transcript_42049/g.112938 Transcript_42049/m.112938 type:complete len:102 (+) Transcript_42049:139-444(+)
MADSAKSLLTASMCLFHTAKVPGLSVAAGVPVTDPSTGSAGGDEGVSGVGRAGYDATTVRCEGNSEELHLSGSGAEPCAGNPEEWCLSAGHASGAALAVPT